MSVGQEKTSTVEVLSPIDWGLAFALAHKWTSADVGNSHADCGADRHVFRLQSAGRAGAAIYRCCSINCR